MVGTVCLIELLGLWCVLRQSGICRSEEGSDYRMVRLFVLRLSYGTYAAVVMVSARFDSGARATRCLAAKEAEERRSLPDPYGYRWSCVHHLHGRFNRGIWRSCDHRQLFRSTPGYGSRAEYTRFPPVNSIPAREVERANNAESETLPAFTRRTSPWRTRQRIADPRVMLRYQLSRTQNQRVDVLTDSSACRQISSADSSALAWPSAV